LFSQRHLERADDAFVRKQVERLSLISSKFAVLFEQTLRATSFLRCPSPGEWQGALRRVVRHVENGTLPNGPRAAMALRVATTCANCGRRFCIDGGRFADLQDRGRSVLCKSCLTASLERQSFASQRLDALRPPVTCEHCAKPFRLSRRKLDLLRSRGRPLLCGTCLSSQMRCWELEQEQLDQTHPRIACAKCSQTFRMKREKVEALAARGTPVLCSVCLKAKMEAESPFTVLRF
jgi:DNA-directed RNA polymerase subunit RPC12/RpoP